MSVAIRPLPTSATRGGELMLSTYALLDMTPKGRNEKNNLTDWVKLHDRYEAANNAGWPAQHASTR
jgi:predicted dithiol-disulfide oxidoreductase (DUF899 family)